MGDFNIKINGVEVNCTRQNAIQKKIENVSVVGCRRSLLFSNQNKTHAYNMLLFWSWSALLFSPLHYITSHRYLLYLEFILIRTTLPIKFPSTIQCSIINSYSIIKTGAPHSSAWYIAGLCIYLSIFTTQRMSDPLNACLN